ncbi:MAG: hypothetical protein DMG13_10265 [Acidobacteria bacterium]|nr:MAG: hypothetical protein DMG13_10265 [Acidobacteriota bacterium]
MPVSTDDGNSGTDEIFCSRDKGIIVRITLRNRHQIRPILHFKIQTSAKDHYQVGTFVKEVEKSLKGLDPSAKSEICYVQSEILLVPSN